MPSLTTLADAQEVEARYIDKVVVYVEGEDDQRVWERIVGFDIADRLEFMVPASGAGGASAVVRRVKEERLRNRKVFGLVDGEMAAVFGKIDRLIGCKDCLFILEGQELDGVLFFSGHELENALIACPELAAIIVQNVSIRDLGKRDRAAVQSELASFARRFYVAALFKYASAHICAGGTVSSILNVGPFRSTTDILKVIRSLKAAVAAEGVLDTKLLMKQLLEIARLVKQRITLEGSGREARHVQLLRLADGKGLVTAIESRWKTNRTIEGHLLERVRLSPFAEAFRGELLSLTGTQSS